MFNTTYALRPSLIILFGALTGVLAISPVAAAERSLFFEETAEAFWDVPYQCASGDIVQGTMLVRGTRDFETPDTDDPNPTARLQFLAICPDARRSAGAASSR
jgi:hypothetical protein